ncbi:MAG TPA: DUF2188 domain-containing protein [Longimicrobiales bacterium]|nr:DUF2188 domain-containing protein [Longimicrobiales bacterium]
MTLLKRKKSAPRKVAKKVTDAVSGRPKTAAVAGLAAATAVGAAAWLTSRRHNGIALHVESDGNGAWLLRQEGTDEPLERHGSKKEAVSAARKYAREHGPSMLTIHKESGAVARRHVYAEA